METDMIKDAVFWIHELGLVPLPEEGGMYQETYRSTYYNGTRVAMTDIYYLLQGEMFSAFHRLKSDEIWHYHVGATLIVHIFNQEGRYENIKLGTEIESGEKLRITIPAGAWFAAEMEDKSTDHFALVSCVVAPGFEIQDFELAKRSELLNQFPEYRDLICRLTRE